jgi:hypothetical protein
MIEKLTNPSDISEDVVNLIAFKYSSEGGLFENLIDQYQRDRNVSDFFHSLRIEYKKLDVPDGTMEMWFSLKLSDVLQRTWEKGPQILVSHMKDKGIEPDDNVFGHRLEAQTCLYKALLMNDQDFQEIFGQRKLL